MALQHFKVFTFDLVGTLIDFERGMLDDLRAVALAHFARTLGRPFDLALSCDDALCEKPDPRYVAYARGRIEGLWGWWQPDILHVAQSQYHDIGVAHRLGITTAWIERRHGMKGSGGTIESEHTRSDHHFHTLAELADAIDAGA